MRIHHIFIAIIMLSLFTVILYSGVKEMYAPEGLNMDEGDYLNPATTRNITDLYAKLDVVSESKNKVLEMADGAPGGSGSDVPGADDTPDGVMQKSGLGLVAAAGAFLYEIPKTLITSLGGFFGINPVFMTVASGILILIVAIILVSSILRNRI